jgi:hypothetical protein
VRRSSAFYDEAEVIGEDVSACFRTLRASDFGFVHQVLTFVRTENESTLSPSRRHEGMYLNYLVLLHRHGRDFMEPDEYRDVLNRTRRTYYRELALGLLSARGSAFLGYHRRGLATSGLRVEYGSLVLQLLREVLAIAGNPGRAVSALIRWARRR